MNGRSSNRFIVYGEVFLTIQINAFLYYLSRMPVLGKIVHGTWYGCYRLKKLCSLFGLALGFVRSALAGNLGALVLLYGLPHLFLRRDALTTGVFLMLFVLLKCVCSVPAGCGLFHSSEEDHAFLNHFCVNPACYYRYKALKEAFFSGFMLFPAVYFLFRNWGLTIALVLLKLCSVLLGNVVYLQFYKMYGRLPGRQAGAAVGHASPVCAGICRGIPGLVSGCGASAVGAVGAGHCMCHSFGTLLDLSSAVFGL